MKKEENVSEKNRKWREWYHKVNYSGHTRYNGQKRRQVLREWYRKYKSQFKCIVCGEPDIACLDFHHKDPSEKVINISAVISQGWSIKRILSEIEKCDPVCSNCHRKQVFKEIIDRKSIKPELHPSQFEQPKYIGCHGNGLGKKPFNETREVCICEDCGKLFPREKKMIRRQHKRGCMKTYCSRKCSAISSHRKTLIEIKPIDALVNNLEFIRSIADQTSVAVG